MWFMCLSKLPITNACSFIALMALSCTFFYNYLTHSPTQMATTEARQPSARRSCLHLGSTLCASLWQNSTRT